MVKKKKTKKKTPANKGDVRDTGSVPALRRSPEEGHGNPLKYSCRGAWWASVHGITQSWTQLKQLSMHAKENGSADGLTASSVCHKQVTGR